MNSLFKFFNYNWLKIIKENIKNNNTKAINKKEKSQAIDLVIVKEFCAIAFVIINFLISYIGASEMYKSLYKAKAIFYGLKESLPSSIVWFVVLTILPFITCIMLKKKIKAKHYLLLIGAYLLSNIYNIIMIIYFITSFINNVLLGTLGIINIFITVIINMHIIVKIKENYLK